MKMKESQKQSDGQLLTHRETINTSNTSCFQEPLFAQKHKHTSMYYLMKAPFKYDRKVLVNQRQLSNKNKCKANSQSDEKKTIKILMLNYIGVTYQPNIKVEIS